MSAREQLSGAAIGGAPIGTREGAYAPRIPTLDLGPSLEDLRRVERRAPDVEELAVVRTISGRPPVMFSDREMRVVHRVSEEVEEDEPDHPFKIILFTESGDLKARVIQGTVNGLDAVDAAHVTGILVATDPLHFYVETTWTRTISTDGATLYRAELAAVTSIDTDTAPVSAGDVHYRFIGTVAGGEVTIQGLRDHVTLMLCNAGSGAGEGVLH
jgi:chorismate mutase